MESLPETRRPAWGRVLLLMLAGGLLGLVLGCLWVTVIGPRVWRTPFRALPAAPGAVQHIAGATVDSVDVTLADGRLLRYHLRETAFGWQPADSPRSESDGGCEPFAARAPRIAGVVERQVACRDLSDAGATAIFVLRDDGRVYYWYHFDSAYLALAALIFIPLMAGLAGVIAGLALFYLQRRRSAGS